jgi:hypothetical protein
MLKRIIPPLSIAILALLVAVLLYRTSPAQVGSYDSQGRHMVNMAVSGATPCHISTATTTACKGTTGVLHSVIVGTGVASATIKIYDIASAGCTGTPGSGLQSIITFPLTLTNPPSYDFHITMANGVCVVTSGLTDVTVTFE